MIYPYGLDSMEKMIYVPDDTDYELYQVLKFIVVNGTTCIVTVKWDAEKGSSI